jgi:predicted signal transduction protein with EAL and GGDEF domain
MGKVVEAIISLGDGLQLPITAEGIESFEVHNLLKGMGNMKGQGFLYGRPESAAATYARLAKASLVLDKGEVSFIEENADGGSAVGEPADGQEPRKRAS